MNVITDYFENREISIEQLEGLPEHIATVICNTFKDKQKIESLIKEALYKGNGKALIELSNQLLCIADDLEKINKNLNKCDKILDETINKLKGD